MYRKFEGFVGKLSVEFPTKKVTVFIFQPLSSIMNPNHNSYDNSSKHLFFFAEASQVFRVFVVGGGKGTKNQSLSRV